MNYKTLLTAALLAVGPLILSATKPNAPQSTAETTRPICRKSGAPVSIRYTPLKIAVGEQAETEVALLNNGPAGKVTVSIAVDPGLKAELLGTPNLSIDAGATVPLKLRIAGLREGRRYLRLRATWTDGRIRSFALPVQVGNGLPKLLKSVVNHGPDGEKISIFKAAEEIRK